jgi:hypothetical protein
MSLTMEPRQISDTSLMTETQQVSEMLVFCSEVVWILFGEDFIPLNCA